MIKLHSGGAAAATGLLALAASATVSAADYQSEVGVAVDHTEFDLDGVPNAETWQLGGTYHFAAVNTEGVPLAEAAFLRRSSYVNGGLVRAEFGDEKIDILAVNLAYYVPNTIFYGRVGFAYLDDFSGDQTDFNATVGVTPLDGLLVTTSFNEEGWDPNITARHVGKLPNSHFYAASVTAVDPDEGHLDLGVDFDYFIDDTFSLGAGFGSGSDDWSVRAQKFFTPKFSVSGRASTGDDGDSFGATIQWRF